MCSNDRPALEKEEIEVTPKMIEAGLFELYAFSPEADLAEDAVEKIFQAMVAAQIQ
jgi:hypothetical protein